MKKTVWSEQESLWIERTSRESEALARAKAEGLVTEGVGNGRLVAVAYTAENGDDGCTVTAVYKCVVEITVPAELTAAGE